MNYSLKVVQFISGDIWGGAESQVFTLISCLLKHVSIKTEVLLFNDNILSKRLRGKGVDVTIINEKRGLLPRLIIRYLEFTNTVKPHVVHVHGYKECFIASVASLFLKKKNRPVIVRTYHGKDVLELNFKYFLLEKFNSLFINHTIAVSKELNGYLQKKKLCKKHNSSVIHNSIVILAEKSATQKIRILSELNIPPGSKIIGTLGRMVPVKGHMHLLQSVTPITHRYSDCYFVIGGDGPLMTENKEYIIKNSLIDRVKFPGFIKDSFSILNVFDIFILPSLHEGIPMVLLEALSLGKPVIASNVGGIPEVVTHAIEALLIEPGRVGSIVNGCLTLLGSPELRKKIAANGKLKIEKHFNALEKSSDLINIYRKVNK